MPSRPSPIFRLADRDYHEDLSVYTPATGDFHDEMLGRLPEKWRIDRQGIWFYCSSPEIVLPQQGWKIHVSAAPGSAHDILDRAVAIAFRHGASFKFALDMNILFLLNSKSWPRGGSGKFITIYPRDNHSFLELIEELHCMTRGLRGPYILSDRRYKDSGVVFYRYGGMQLFQQLNVKGEKVPMLVAPDGTQVPDLRLAYPVTPDWAGTVLPDGKDDLSSEENNGLRNGRYTIESVFTFSNAGGVYLAQDNHTGKKVVIKEARPCVNATVDGYDAIELLKKEGRLLAVLAPTGIAPQPVDLFQEWEHWFLVQEHVEGVPLSSHSAAHNILLRTRPQPADYEAWRDTVLTVARNLAEILDVLHSRDIVFGDLSPNNLLITEQGKRLKIIDFEGASQAGIDRPTTIYTAGFVSGARIAGRSTDFKDDCYSAGAVLLSYLFPLNGLLHLKPEAKHELLSSIQRDAKLPLVLIQLIEDLMSEDEKQRPRPDQMRALLATCSCEDAEAKRSADDTVPDYDQVIEGIVSHIGSVATYQRKDRLFPADPKLFLTNPLNLAYGAAGIAYALQKLTGKYPQGAADWILKSAITPQNCPPGLYVGMSGIAWCLLAMGNERDAERLFQQTFNHPLLDESADLFYGLAGWGMTALYFFEQTGDERYLNAAQGAGRKLLARFYCARSGAWKSGEHTPVGLAHGGSGIALFLLYLYLATNEERYLGAGEQILSCDLAAGTPTRDGGLSWSSSAEAPSPLYPYWRHGSAGVGTAVLRFNKLSGAPRYQPYLDRILIDTDRKYSVAPGQFMGLAGIGGFLLDAWDFSGDDRFLNSANKIATGIANFQVERNGIAFPGSEASRLSCDYGTGSAGIGLFLKRLSNGCKADFLLDFLFHRRRDCGASPGKSPANDRVLVS